MPTGPGLLVARIRIVDPTAQVAVVSDIDDTVLVTALPRPLRAAWNTFVRHESTRRPVRGMATLYRTIAAEHPDVLLRLPLDRRLERGTGARAVPRAARLPPGPLLMTDWGPTPGLVVPVRAGAHSREIRRLLDDLPDAQWLLVGDDGQHDPEIYAEAADEAPERVRAVVIRS